MIATGKNRKYEKNAIQLAQNDTSRVSKPDRHTSVYNESIIIPAAFVPGWI